MKLLSVFAVTLALSAVTFAQNTAPKLSLERVVQTAFAENLDIKNAANALTQATATFQARNADPTALITDVLQAQQAANLAKVNLNAARLEVMNDSVSEFLNLSENTDNLELLTAQVKLLERNLEIVKARLQSRTATTVDVQRSETDLNGARQQLSDARAQRPIISARLGRLLGLAKNDEPQIADAPKLQARALNSAQLEAALDERAPQVVQAAQAVEFAELIVKVSDNDYTPEQDQRKAKTDLENARRALATATRRATNQLRDAVRSAADALEGAKVATQNAATAQRTLANDRVKLQNGLIARVQLESSELTARRAEFDATRAANGYWRALAGVSLAAGADVTGWVKP
jgi:outer membrane protein